MCPERNRITSEQSIPSAWLIDGGEVLRMQHKSWTIASIISPAMRELMRRVEAAAHFLLILRPGTTKLDFFAPGDSQNLDLPLLDQYQQIMDRAFDVKYREIVRDRKNDLSDLCNPQALFDLCGEIVEATGKALPKGPLLGE